MKSTGKILIYVGVLVLAALLLYYLLTTGGKLETGRHLSLINNKTAAAHASSNFAEPLAVLLAQIVVILLAGNLLGFVCRKIGQPKVIGEILAGIALGPSLFGRYFPGFSSLIFPVKSLVNLQFLSQLGLILFMFIVGMELDLKSLKNKSRDALVISHISIILPFILGMTLAYFVYQQLAPAGIPFFSFSLFFGIAMSITAFPVLARICQERGIDKTPLGALVITCAAADDITVWCVLATIIAVVKTGSVSGSLLTIALAVIFVIVMLKAVKPLLKWIHVNSEAGISFGLFFITLIISAYATEVIGIHVIFGAFIAGIIMPYDPDFRGVFIEKAKDVTLHLLLPLFFIFTGLRTQIGLLNNVYLWGMCALITGIAVAGKFLGSTLAARVVGQNWYNSLSIGALMNTRGLMELIVLNIGYDLGVINQQVFAMMVIMALVTTLMTVPVLDLLNKIFRKESGIILK